MSKKTFYLLLMGLSIIGIFTVYYSTYWGVGLLDWDSFNYISSARNLASGMGYVIPLNNDKDIPMTHFPPMLPSVLAIFEVLGTDAIDAARILNIALFAASIVLIGITLQEITKSYYFGLLGSILFVSSNVLIELHSWALSEPLLLFLTLSGFLIFYKYSQHGKVRMLIFTSIFLGLAVLTKYAGAANVGAILVTILLLKNRGYKNKLKHMAVLALISVLPMVLWTAHNYTLTETINDRGLGYYPLGLGNLMNALQTFFSWYFPEFLLLESKKVFLSALIVITVIAAIALTAYYGKKYGAEIMRRVRHANFNALTLAYASYTVLYILTVLAAKTFFDPKIGMSNRMLSPVLLSSLVLVISGLSSVWNLKNNYGRGMVIMLSTYLVIFSFWGTIHKVPDLHDNGLGLNRKEMNNSEAMQLLEELAAEKTIYNNYSFALYLRTRQAGYKFNNLPDHNVPADGVIFAIFKSKSPQPHAIIARYEENLELLVDDMIASVYLFEPAEK